MMHFNIAYDDVSNINRMAQNQMKKGLQSEKT